MQKEITWNQFSKVYGLGITEHKAHDVEIVPSKFGFEPTFRGKLFKNENNTFYTFNVYNLETDRDVLTQDEAVESLDEILEIIADEFNIVEM